MVRGRFNDILEANRHYLAIEEDFGNLDEALRRFSDLSVRRAVVEEAYGYVSASHTYAHRMRQIANILRGAPQADA
jgi:hypothetical protein